MHSHACVRAVLSVCVLFMSIAPLNLCACSPKAPGEGLPTVLMGAEGAGVVVAVGPGVTKLKVQLRNSMYPAPGHGTTDRHLDMLLGTGTLLRTGSLRKRVGKAVCQPNENIAS